MTRPLRVARPAETFEALRAALAGGDAVHPVPDGGEVSAPPREVERRVAVVVATSGSSGAPKLVALSADAVLASAAASASSLGGDGQWLLALPVHYIAGINVLVRSITAGIDPVVAEGRFDAASFTAAAGRMDAPVRLASFVPAQLARLVSSEDPEVLRLLRRFDRILVGGQATPDSLLEAALELGLNVTRSYGSSETCGGCVYDGVPIGDTRVRAVDGELRISGSVLAEGYLGEDALTRSRFPAQGGAREYRTGDAGEVVEGVVRVIGRLDDVLISGGVKVSLGAVEEHVRRIPGQADAIVVAVPHAEWGQAPAVVTTVPVELDTLQDAVAAMGVAARPAQVMVVDRMPQLPSGKPDRIAAARLAASAG
ncbi:AMP-binding protein [Lysobacter korlensis]|uniref:AMP-binding protein n=1 Tax=Lysobacter korlensis TaxID=553636 RepID=A0ABV6RVT9_9GAMM